MDFLRILENSTDDVTGSHAVFINAVTGERL